MPAHVPQPEGDFDFGCSDFVWTPNQHRKVCRSCQEWHSSDPGEASDVVDVGMTLHFLLNSTPYLSLSSQGTIAIISELQDWFTARRELSKSDMAHDATWLLTLFLSNNFEVWKWRAVLACLAQGFLRYRGAEGWTFANS